MIDKFADRGLRYLTLAYQEVLDERKESLGGLWQFVSRMPLFDPPRHDSVETVRRAWNLRVNVKMITDLITYQTRQGLHTCTSHIHEHSKKETKYSIEGTCCHINKNRRTRKRNTGRAHRFWRATEDFRQQIGLPLQRTKRGFFSTDQKKGLKCMRKLSPQHMLVFNRAFFQLRFLVYWLN